MTDVDDFLEHYGVKGMRWGVRRSSGNRPRSDDARTTEGLIAKKKTTGIRSLSNDELRVVNNRLQLERQFSQLTTQTGTIQRGVGYIRDVLSVGRTMNDAVNFANSNGGQQIAGLLRRGGSDGGS